ncbi:MAG: sensor histidine kinase [Leadbetterella sp.]|nr:sensor histidine kinase [Leadbetterella sp.]
MIAPIDLDVIQAVPIGLILNEAISNAFKYAFPDKRNGVVAISMEHGEADQFKLTIADNGTGLPPGFDPRKSASLGMSLMRGLSKQLHGSFDLKNEDGLTISIILAKDKTFQSSAQSQTSEMMA